MTANVVPSQVTKAWKQFETGDVAAARCTQDEIQALNEAMFYETNPIPAKTALAMMGRIADEFRLPLVRMSDEQRSRLEAVLRNYGII